MPRNVEIKASVKNICQLHELARSLSGSDGVKLIQEDTFFNIPNGRLKLRKIKDQKEELIFYKRPDTTGPRISFYKKVDRLPGELSGEIKDLLALSLGIRGEVKKTRTLYIVDQTRVHVDEVHNLGNFMELEVVLNDNQSEEEGQSIAHKLMEKLNVKQEDLMDRAYIDVILGNKTA